jgi:hypothetical protein
MKRREFTPEEQARIQRRLRERGMTFEVFLPEDMADWLRGKLAAGVFDDARTAGFVAFQDLLELDRHPQVRRQLLTAMLDASVNDPSPSVPAEEAFASLDAKMAALAAPDSDEIEINGMKHDDFQIGMEFFTATGRWRVTDIGTRTIIAIKLDQSDPRNYNGPPYSIPESVFDEYDFAGCEPANTVVQREKPSPGTISGVDP